MTRSEAIKVLHACKPVYERFVKIVKYQPTPQEQECLVKFKHFYESELLEDDSIIEEAGIDVDTLAWLVGYVTNGK